MGNKPSFILQNSDDEDVDIGASTKQNSKIKRLRRKKESKKRKMVNNFIERNGESPAPRASIPIPRSNDLNIFVDRRTQFQIDPEQEKIYQINYDAELGCGAFGRVFGGIIKTDGTPFAVKVVEKNKLTETGLMSIKNEAAITATISHPNIIKFYYITDTINCLSIYMELFPGGDLLNYINRFEYISECNAYRIFRQLTKAVKYLHSNSIVHRDIKLDNLLYNNENDMRVVLADFGLATKREKNDPLFTVACGTPNYLAPEILNEGKFDGYASDIWAMGVTLFALVAGRYPFTNDVGYTGVTGTNGCTCYTGDESSLAGLYHNIRECNIEYPTHISENCSDLLHWMFIYGYKSRIDINLVKQHPWMTNWQQEIEKDFYCNTTTIEGRANRYRSDSLSRSTQDSDSNLSSSKPCTNRPNIPKLCLLTSQMSNYNDITPAVLPTRQTPNFFTRSRRLDTLSISSLPDIPSAKPPSSEPIKSTQPLSARQFPNPPILYQDPDLRERAPHKKPSLFKYDAPLPPIPNDINDDAFSKMMRGYLDMKA
jgi:serine/threonine protein kinase